MQGKKFSYKEIDLDHKITDLPAIFCTSCLEVKPQMLECPKCHNMSCHACMEMYRQRTHGIAAGHHSCFTCRHQGKFDPENKILSDIKGLMLFQCKNACQQVFPYKELLGHTSHNLCRPDYIRNNDNMD